MHGPPQPREAVTLGTVMQPVPMRRTEPALSEPAEKRRGESFRREDLACYARPHLGRSLLDLATSVVPYLALLVAMDLALKTSYLLVLLLAVPAAGFLV